jgi:hypothetical protein
MILKMDRVTPDRRSALSVRIPYPLPASSIFSWTSIESERQGRGDSAKGEDLFGGEHPATPGDQPAGEDAVAADAVAEDLGRDPAEAQPVVVDLERSRAEPGEAAIRNHLGKSRFKPLQFRPGPSEFRPRGLEFPPHGLEFNSKALGFNSKALSLNPRAPELNFRAVELNSGAPVFNYRGLGANSRRANFFPRAF